MLLMILRHADAEPRAARDRDRGLTGKGIAQSERVAKFCAKRELLPELILTSPYRRAVETAEIVANTLQVEMQVVPFLECGMSPDLALESLREYRRFNCLMWVGHQPDLGDLIARLLQGMDPEGLRVRKASLTGIELDPERPLGAALQFFVPSSLM